MPKTVDIKNIDYPTYRKLFDKKNNDGFGDKSWTEYFAYLCKNLTVKTTIKQLVREATKELFPLWMQNFADNLPFIRYGDDATLTPGKASPRSLDWLKRSSDPSAANPPQGSAIVIGRGPSLYNKRHLKLLGDSQYHGYVFATDGVLIDCLKHDVVPDLTVTVDGSLLIKKFYDHPLVEKCASELNIALISTVNHEVYKLLVEFGCNIFWYHPVFDDWRDRESFTTTQRLMTKSSRMKEMLPYVRAGGNAGTATWVIAIKFFKTAPIALIGIDFGYPAGTKLEDTPYWSTFIDRVDDVGKMPVMYREVYHPYFKDHAKTDHTFALYRQKFLEFQTYAPAWFHKFGGTINCTEGGTLFGAGITCMRFHEFLSKYKN